MALKKNTLKSFSSLRIQDTYIISSITVSALHPLKRYMQKQHTAPAPNLKVHFMISSTQHLNIYSSLKIYLVQEMLKGFTASAARLDEGL